MGKPKKTYVIADLSAWSRLQTTDVRHLSFRAWLGQGDTLLTSTNDMTDARHLAYIHSLPIGIKDIIPLRGRSPVEAVLADDETLSVLAQGLYTDEIALAFFEGQLNGPEVQLVEKLSFLSGVQPDEIWRRASATHPRLSGLGSKIQQRRLAEEKSAPNLFLPWMTAEKTAVDILRKVEAIMHLTGAARVLVRVDGEASGDGQSFFPDESIDDITHKMSHFSAQQVIVEPAVKHKSLSALLFITEDEVKLRALTVQLESTSRTLVGDKAETKSTWCGNWIYAPFDNCVMNEVTASRAALAGLNTGELLRCEGVRGKVSVDLLLIDECLPNISIEVGSVRVTEANVRETNGGYALDGLAQLGQVHGPSSGALLVCKPRTHLFRGFSDLEAAFGDLLYRGYEPHGVIPVVTGTLPSQTFLYAVARSPADLEEVIQQSWKILDCMGEPPKITIGSSVTARL